MTATDLIAELNEISAEIGEITVPVDLREQIESWLDAERLKQHAANPVALEESV